MIPKDIISIINHDPRENMIAEKSVPPPSNHLTHVIPTRTFCLYNRDVCPLDMDNVTRRTTAIIIDNCTSDDWHAVITCITKLKQVTELTATRCGLDDLQIHPLYAMEQLRKLVLGNSELIQMEMNCAPVAGTGQQAL